MPFGANTPRCEKVKIYTNKQVNNAGVDNEGGSKIGGEGGKHVSGKRERKTQGWKSQEWKNGRKMQGGNRMRTYYGKPNTVLKLN